MGNSIFRSKYSDKIEHSSKNGKIPEPRELEIQNAQLSANEATFFLNASTIVNQSARIVARRATIAADGFVQETTDHPLLLKQNENKTEAKTSGNSSQQAIQIGRSMNL